MTVDRRARRRQETIEEILEIAEAIMTEEGVNGLSLAEIARRLGVQPPSLYKYFPSLMAVYNALFKRGQVANLAVIRAAMEEAEPGLPAIVAGLDAACAWSMDHRGLAQLMWWRPVPSFEPSEDAFAPSIEMVAVQRAALREAVKLGQLGPGAAKEEGVYAVSIITAGALTQAMANEPDVPWGKGRFSPLFPKLMTLLPALYPPRPERAH
ncbi:MAG TPA: TetR/AcrR family transcriptional regulator [Acidimicrobiia bacterium]|nr:TetR/AcrR family transcriptional regulator [Acidimicrobiia bacterium]